MTIGSIEIDDGSRVPGFLVEAAATEGCADITAYGDWPSYLAATRVRLDSGVALAVSRASGGARRT